MKTDSLFYKLFQQAPQLVLEQAGVENYQFRSEEIKQTAFRLDGVLTPPSEKPNLPLVFVEVQFQVITDFTVGSSVKYSSICARINRRIRGTQW
jgi:predicted transposase YdaD